MAMEFKCALIENMKEIDNKINLRVKELLLFIIKLNMMENFKMD